MELLRGLELKTNEYLGIGTIGIFFACAILFWCLKKEKSVQIRFFTTYILVAVIGMMNPLSLYVIDRSGNMNVYERFFWLLMTPMFVAFTFAVIVQNKNKLMLLCLIVLLLGGKSVFTETEYTKADSIEKISAEAIEVSEIIMRDFEGLDEDAEVEPNRMGIESPRAVVPEPINEDIRMYNANIVLWYVRKDFGSYYGKSYKKLAKLMTLNNSEVPVSTLVSAMKKQNFEYFVLGDWQQLTGDVDKHNITLIGQTEKYRVYKYMEPLVFYMKQYADVEGYQCMSYTIRNSKGKLIVIDGGRAWQSLSLVEQIQEYGGVVDAWIITHAHDDHAGVLASVLEAGWHESQIKIKEILIGDMDYEQVMSEKDSRSDMVAYLQMGLEKHDNVRVLKAGDELDVIGLHMKVLHTCNRTVVENSDNILNDGSMVFKLSGKKRSVLFLADTADNTEKIASEVTDPSQGSEIGRLIADEILANYPDDVKSWAVQMSHHGNGSYPDYFYEAIAPKKAFFPAPDWLMENKNRETGETGYYSTPHYVELMERLGAEVISFSSKKRYVKFR
ncbi:MAG: MBL fold metallo-hydrolase [Lachnospiraceae bacterium]|nr:MBL fold metallo-hydrolase [Lachnospiraceae bacterium]